MFRRNMNAFKEKTLVNDGPPPRLFRHELWEIVSVLNKILKCRQAKHMGMVFIIIGQSRAYSGSYHIRRTI